MSAEDGMADTVRPRLDRMGADVSRILALAGPISHEDDAFAYLENQIAGYQPALVVIDPLVYYMGGGVDLHRANEVRAVTARLADLAEQHGCAILAIRHLTKASTSKAIYRGLGSIDITAAARSVLLAGTDPNNPVDRAIIQTKNNLAMLGPAIGYCVTDGIFVWTGASDLTAATMLGAETEDSGSPIDEAIEFLLQTLAAGPRPSAEVKKSAATEGIADRTLRRAQKALGVVPRAKHIPGKQGVDHWNWELPAETLGGQKKLGGHISTKAIWPPNPPFVSESPQSPSEGGHLTAFPVHGQNGLDGHPSTKATRPSNPAKLTVPACVDCGVRIAGGYARCKECAAASMARAQTGETA
jgi:hypothetical protein